MDFKKSNDECLALQIDLTSRICDFIIIQNQI